MDEPIRPRFTHVVIDGEAMKPETQKAIELLNNAPLLRGGYGELDASKYSMVSSFGEACVSAESPEWEQFIVDLSNGVNTIPIQRRYNSECGDTQAWLKMREENHKALKPAIRKILQAEWTSITRFSFERLLSEICVELEISHIIKPVFFYPLIFPVLCAGHFPCGWDGDPIPEDWSQDGRGVESPPDKLVLPSGKLKVYRIMWVNYNFTANQQ